MLDYKRYNDKQVHHLQLSLNYSMLDYKHGFIVGYGFALDTLNYSMLDYKLFSFYNDIILAKL